jgi:hypothetical protein
MPLAADPTATHRIVLLADRDKAPQPAFVYRYLSYRQWIALSQFQEGLAAMDAADAIRQQEHWLTAGLVGWEHICCPDTGQPLPFDPQRLLDVITITEAQELIGQRMLSNIPDLETKKKLSSPSDCGTESSAKAAGGSPDARTSPAP